MEKKKHDYYEILGVDRDCDSYTIKKAFRKLAKKYHPDRNGARDAAERFAEINEAYEVLGNSEKRRDYDRFGHGDEEKSSDFSFASREVFSSFFDIINESQAFTQSYDQWSETKPKKKRKSKKRGHKSREITTNNDQPTKSFFDSLWNEEPNFAAGLDNSDHSQEENEFWRQCVGNPDYGYYQGEEWVWNGYFDENDQWIPNQTDPEKPIMDQNNEPQDGWPTLPVANSSDLFKLQENPTISEINSFEPSIHSFENDSQSNAFNGNVHNEINKNTEISQDEDLIIKQQSKDLLVHIEPRSDDHVSNKLFDQLVENEETKNSSATSNIQLEEVVISNLNDLNNTSITNNDVDMNHEEPISEVTVDQSSQKTSKEIVTIPVEQPLSEQQDNNPINFVLDKLNNYQTNLPDFNNSEANTLHQKDENSNEINHNNIDLANNNELTTVITKLIHENVQPDPQLEPLSENVSESLMQTLTEVVDDMIANRLPDDQVLQITKKRNLDISYEVKIPQILLFNNATRRLKYYRCIPCKTCHSTGADQNDPNAFLECFSCNNKEAMGAPCLTCKGYGKLIRVPCKKCKGKSYVKEQIVLDINLPITDRLKLKVNYPGFGHIVDEWNQGDLTINFTVIKSKLFKLDKNNVWTMALINHKITRLGGEILIPTLKQLIRVKLDPGTKPNDQLIIEGQGFPPRYDVVTKQFMPQGNLIVRVIEPKHKFKNLKHETFKAYIKKFSRLVHKELDALTVKNNHLQFEPIESSSQE